MPQISEACPDLLSAVYWHDNTSGLYVIAGDHSLNYLLISLLVFWSQAIKCSEALLQFGDYLKGDFFKGPVDITLKIF